MEINVKTLKNVTILELGGRLDASSAQDFRNKLKQFIQDDRLNFVFDLENINFLDSSGIGVLVASLRSVNKLNGDIKISNVKDHVRSVIEITRLHQIFEIFDNSEIAALSF